MNAATRLAAFAVVLCLAFGGAAWVGAAIDPTYGQPLAEHAGGGRGRGDLRPHPEAPDHGDASVRGHSDAAARERAAAQDGSFPSGVAVSQDGFTLDADRTSYRTDRPARLKFRVLDARGRALRDQYELEAEREMHLIVVRADASSYQHLHPRKREDGTWVTDVELPAPGTYRAYADFRIDGKQRTLTTSLFAPGEFRPKPLPAPASTDESGPFRVTLAAPKVTAGEESPLTFTVTRNGKPVDALEPYLGARGHLVALREGDLAYLHVHPTDVGGHQRAAGSRNNDARTNAIGFTATFPTPGRYRLFLQFRTDGEVRTVAYTVEVPR